MTISKDEHLHAIAGELLANMPVDYDDTLTVIEHLRLLTEWRRSGVLQLPVYKSASVIQLK